MTNIILSLTKTYSYSRLANHITLTTTPLFNIDTVVVVALSL